MYLLIPDIPCKKEHSKRERVVVLYHEYDHDFVEKNLMQTANVDGSVQLLLTKLKHDGMYKMFPFFIIYNFFMLH